MATQLHTPDSADRTPADPVPADGGPAARFDDFYDAAWHPLLVQTFAYTGSLAVARDAVRFGFVDAWHHWARAEKQGPKHYVREKAFARAALRTRLGALRRGYRGSTEERLTLKALQDLPPLLRKGIVLAVLSQADLEDIGRALGEPQTRTLEIVDTAMAQLSLALQCSPNQAAARMHALGQPARAAAQPTAREVRFRGVRRRRLWLAGGIVAVVALTFGAGAFVMHRPTPAVKLPPSLSPQVRADLLLTTDDLAPLGLPARWTAGEASDNTKGTGINTFCQASRFADPRGLKAVVRSYTLDGVRQRTATQTIELSRTPEQAQASYRRVLSWFGGCQTSRLQLLSTYDVTGLGNQAEVIKMRAQSPQGQQALSSYAVGVVRTGHVVTWTAVVTRGAQSPPVDQLVSVLASSLDRVCATEVSGSCKDQPQVKENPPPPSHEQAGMLAITDLPPVPDVDAKWVGTDAQHVRANPAATTCDDTDLDAAGAGTSLTRTFLTPGAQVPPRFGLSETIGTFAGPVGAKGLIAQVVSRMNKCTDTDLGAHISDTTAAPHSDRGSAYYFWRLDTEINTKDSIVYWMGVARVGSNVAQVTFVAGTGKQDLTKETFQALVERARDRLFELPATPSTSPSASASPSAGSDGG